MSEEDKKALLEAAERIRLLNQEILDLLKRKEGLAKALSEVGSSLSQRSVEINDLEKLILSLTKVVS